MFIFAEWSNQLHSMGLVHIIGIVLAILFGIGGGILAKRTTKPDKVYAITGITFIVLEALKVIFFLCTTGTYPLNRVPYQMCTVEMFFLWAIPLVKNEKIKRGMIAYTLIGLMAAVFYFVNPVSLLTTPYIFLSLQAMIWHHLVIMIGVFSVVRFGIYGKKGKTFIIDGYLFWLALTILAIILDVIFAKIIPEEGINFFYLSPNQESITYIGLNWIFKEPKPYPLFLVGFIIYYTFGVSCVYGVLSLIGRIRDKRESR